MNIQMIARMLGIDQNLANQVLNQSKNYSQDMNGLIKAINDNGGMAQVDRAMGYINNPIVGKALKMIGIDKSQIQTIYKDLKSMQNGNYSSNAVNNSNNYNDRLKRLK